MKAHAEMIVHIDGRHSAAAAALHFIEEVQDSFCHATHGSKTCHRTNSSALHQLHAHHVGTEVCTLSEHYHTSQHSSLEPPIGTTIMQIEDSTLSTHCRIDSSFLVFCAQCLHVQVSQVDGGFVHVVCATSSRLLRNSR